MENKMNIYYDEEGDYLEITSVDIFNCYFDNTGNGIFKIIDKETKEVKGIAIFSFKARTKNLEELKLSLPLSLILFLKRNLTELMREMLGFR